MRVGDVMIKKVITVPSGSTYAEAAKILYKSGISGAPVVDNKNNLVGIVSEKDLFKVLFPFYDSFYKHPESYTDFEERENKIDEIKDKKIANFITMKVTSVKSDDLVMKAGGLMLAHSYHRLPVVEEGKLIGIVTREEIFEAVLKKHLKLRRFF